MTAQANVIGMVFCQKILEVAKEVFDIEKIAKDLSLVMCECIRQRLEAKLHILKHIPTGSYHRGDSEISSYKNPVSDIALKSHIYLYSQ